MFGNAPYEPSKSRARRKGGLLEGLRRYQEEQDMRRQPGFVPEPPKTATPPIAPAIFSTVPNKSPQPKLNPDRPTTGHGRDAVDGYLKSWMVLDDYRKPGDAGNRLRDAIRKGWQVAYPGPYVPGSFNRGVEPSVDVPTLESHMQAAGLAEHTTEPSEAGIKSGKPSDIQVAHDDMAPSPFEAIPWLLRPTPPSKSEPTTPMPTVPAKPESIQPEDKNKKDGENASPGSPNEEPPPDLPEIPDIPFRDYNKGDENLYELKPEDRGGHIVHGGKTPTRPGFKGDPPAQDPNLNFDRKTRLEYDAYMQSSGKLYLDQLEKREIEKIEPSQSFIWKSQKPHKVIDGKPTRINGLKGKNTRYYQWDEQHGTIEVYDSNRKHIGEMDSITGEWRKPKETSYYIKGSLEDDGWAPIRPA